MHNIAVVIPKYGLVGGAELSSSEITERLANQTGFNFHVYGQSLAEIIRYDNISPESPLFLSLNF